MTNATTTIAEYSATEAVIADLRDRYAGVSYDVATPEGMKDAVKARAELRKWRTGLEKVRVEIKAPALQRCQQIDSEAKRITTALLAIESPIDAQIKAEEGKAAALAAAAEQARLAEVAAKARAFDELQAAKRREEEIAERERMAKQRAELEAAEAARRAADAEAAKRRAEEDRKAAEERARLQKQLDDERAAIAAKAAAMAAEAAAMKAAEDARLVAGASLAEAARMALELLRSSGLSDRLETRALAAALDRVDEARP